MKYEDINKPIELLKFMEDNVEYGFCDLDGNKYNETMKDFNIKCNELWKLSSPEELLKNKMGICFDQVELERDWFTKNNYKFKTIFIMFFNTNLPTHTFLAYEENNNWYWFEHSDFANKGIHKFNNYEELIDYQKKKHIDYVSSFMEITEKLLADLHIIEFDKPEYDINGKEYISYIINGGKFID